MMAGMGRCPGLEWAGLNLVWVGLERTCYQKKKKKKKKARNGELGLDEARRGEAYASGN